MEGISGSCGRKAENMICIDDEFAVAVFAIKGYSVDRSKATYRATGNNLDKTLNFLNWTREKRRLDEEVYSRLELREHRNVKVQQLRALGFADRAAFLALSRNSWDTDRAAQYLKLKFSKREKKGSFKEEAEEIKNACIKNKAKVIKNECSKDKAEEIKNECIKEETGRRKKRNSGPESVHNKADEELFVSEFLLDSLEQQTHVNRGTCRRVFLGCRGDVTATVSQLLKYRASSNQRMMRSEEKRQARIEREKDIKKLMELTGYDREKCEKILAYFGNNFNKAERQYSKFLFKKQEGEKLEIENEENNMLTEFRIEELDLSERRDLEQYFFSRDTLVELIKVMDKFDNPCCMVCPSVAHASHYLNRELTLLDIDDRFSYLPRYIKYNLYQPSPLTQNFDMILFDPPYFQIPMSDMLHSVDTVSQYQTDTPLIIGFLRRNERALLKSFSKYHLKATRFHPGYARVKPSKRVNYLFYSNWGGLPNNKHSL